MSNNITIVPYSEKWEKYFLEEKKLIKDILKDNLVDIHHVGSTAVLGLSSKEKIDILLIVKNPLLAIEPLKKLDYEYRGEWNIPFKYGMRKRIGRSINMHMCIEDHLDIEPILLFRDFLRKNTYIKQAYETLKIKLASLKDSKEKKDNPIFTQYTLGKYNFICDVLYNKIGFNGKRFVYAAHYSEWEAVRNFRNQYFFDDMGIKDPYTWTFNHNDHKHFILYKGIDIIGYAHVQLWPENRAALRIVVIDQNYQKQGYGKELMGLTERWLKENNYCMLHIASSPNALAFYKHMQYQEIPFNDPDGYPVDPEDIEIGKRL